MLALYAPALRAGFVNWDDDRFITANPLLQGSVWGYIAAAFTRVQFQAYHPLHLLSYLPDRSVLRERRGSCLGLGALYLALAGRLDVPVDGVLLPGHFFVRTRGPGGHNIELLRRGEAMPDPWYREEYGPWPEAGAYFRPVSPTELAAIHWYNRGNDLRKGGDLAAAQAAFARAAQAFPDFAEASASLGAVQQLRGDLVGAERSYRQAARAWPDLPGLQDNLDLLQAAPTGSALR